MGGGDDYELVFTGPPRAELDAVGIRIGTCTADITQRPPATGWEHEWR
jgi:thiamine monophosphate kinase